MDTVTARGSGLLTLTNHRAQASETAWMVPGAGIEPARLSPQDFKSCMSTYFIIRAHNHCAQHSIVRRGTSINPPRTTMAL